MTEFEYHEWAKYQEAIGAAILADIDLQGLWVQPWASFYVGNMLDGERGRFLKAWDMMMKVRDGSDYLAKKDKDGRVVGLPLFMVELYRCFLDDRHGSEGCQCGWCVRVGAA